MVKPEIGKLYNYIEHENSFTSLQVSRNCLQENSHYDYYLISTKLLQPIMILDHKIVDRYKTKMLSVKFLARDGQICYHVFWGYNDFNSLFVRVQQD